MSRLALILFAMVSTTLMGSFIVIALAIGFDTTKPIIISAVLGFIVSVPVSSMIAGKLSELT